MFEVGFHFIPPALPASREVRWELPSVRVRVLPSEVRVRSEEHTSELQSPEAISYGVAGVAGVFVGLPPPPGGVVAGAGICVLGASVTGAEVGAPETGADVRKSPGPGVPLGFFVIPG